MALKWVSALAATAAMSAFAAANLTAAGSVPLAVNLLLVAVAGTALCVLVTTVLHERADARVSVLSDFLVTRLDEIVARLDGLDVRLDKLPQSSDVIPMPPRRHHEQSGPTRR